MNASTILQLSLVLLRGVLSEANAKGAADVVSGVSAAIAELEKVHGTPVTKEQLDGLSIEKLW